jgi:hypothetical protein
MIVNGESGLVAMRMEYKAEVQQEEKEIDEMR